MFLYRCDKCNVDMYDVDDITTVKVGLREAHLCVPCFDRLYVWFGWK